jgi:hypothetical protein
VEPQGVNKICIDRMGFDANETRKMAEALGWGTPEGGMNLRNDLFGIYTIAIKK